MTSFLDASKLLILLFVIHEGHKVEIKDNSMHEWKEIELEDGKVGWIPASSIEII